MTERQGAIVLSRGIIAAAAALAAMLTAMCAASPPGVDAPPPTDSPAWATIAPFFRPPPEFAADLGPYRSPLLFDDGRPVRTAADWPARRDEILRYWHAQMGPWPPLLKDPRLEELATDVRDCIVQKKVRVPVAPDLAIDGYLLLPPGEGRRPAVLVVYYDAETGAGLVPKNLSRAFGWDLARRGFVTLSVGWPRGYTDAHAARLQTLSCLSYMAANCWGAMAARPEVDAARIGVVGHSFGGKWSLFAGALWEKFACVAVSDPGVVFDETRPNVNYWEPWYLGAEEGRTRARGVITLESPRTGPYKRIIEAGHDLHELHALIAPRPLLVSGGAEDQPARWRALNHAVAVNRLLGQDNRVAMTNRPMHGPTDESNAQMYAFFEHFLNGGKGEGAAVAAPAQP